MTLDLDELERKAKAAISVPHVTLGKDDALVIRDGPVAEFTREATPTAILALIKRVRDLERQVEDAKEAAWERDMGDDL